MKKINYLLADLIDTLESKQIVKFMFYLGVIILMLLFITIFNSAFVIFLLFITASLSTFYKLYLKIPIGFELITLMVILLAHTRVIGIFPLILLTIVTVFTARIISAGIHPEMFAQILNYIFIILISGFFSELNIVIAGMTLIIIFNIIRFIYGIFLFGFEPISTTLSCIGSIVIYYVILSNFAPLILKSII